MKRINILVVGAAIMGLALVSCQENAEKKNGTQEIPEAFKNYEKTTGGAQILFDTLVHDFGAVNKENALEHSFYFINSGDAPLVISRARPGCGCTGIEYPEGPIEPGQVGAIEVEIDASSKITGRQFNVNAQVYSNAQDSIVLLGMKGVPVEE